MQNYELIAPCHFGLESVLKREIGGLGYEISNVSDGKVSFLAGPDGIARANTFLRTTERILLKAGEFRAVTFDELFEQTKAVAWENYIPKNGKFWITKANSVKSALFSPKDIQSIMKKAIVERLKSVYHIDWFPEDGPEFPIRVSFMKDTATVGIDTSGESLHKRGYRRMKVKAPITETLAAALIMLTPFSGDRILVDPFCGSGTFPIEAAMIALNMAPGRNRSFLAEQWKHLIKERAWQDARTEADDCVRRSVKTRIQGYDLDPEAVDAARANAAMAGVGDYIHLQRRDIRELSHPGSYGFIITNPPYGERLEDKEALPELYRVIGERYQSLDRWSMYLITSYEDAERYLGRKADKNRKIYNGMIKTYYYQYLGPRPPKRQPLEKQI
ncbi:MAG: class I SAM-dependent RNA methyltransferase [Blautia sp.]|nr:class I SAM-dependent RNA methyltransferase [Blautia sp.]